MMSSSGEGNFMARWGVDTIVPSRFNDDLPKSTLYDVSASTNRYRILIVFELNAPSSPNLVYKSM